MDRKKEKKRREGWKGDTWIWKSGATKRVKEMSKKARKKMDDERINLREIKGKKKKKNAKEK